MAGPLEVYNKEIFNFLRTVTIKFEHFALTMCEEGSTPDSVDNPYYQRLAGNYLPNDKRIQVTTVEDGTKVEFNKDLFTKYPQTGALYRIPNKEYFYLEEQYPEMAGLIRTIVYPVEDIKAAISAPNFSLLAYDASLLESHEREDLITCLKNYLAYVSERWWVPEYIYEEQYAPTFWAMLWQQLPLVLLTRRFENIRTPYAHSYHVWEYLQSKGLADYRDVLSHKQAMWLYRNIDYIHANRGKNQTLKILAENLLPDVAVSLMYYDMYQETSSRWKKDLTPNPIFRTYTFTDDKYVRDETFSDLNFKLVDLEVEHRNDAEFINDKELRLGEHGHNILDTKFLEFKKEPVDTRAERGMVNFFLDTLFYRYSKGKVKYDCMLRDPLSTTEYKLSVADVILLWHWACWKAVGEDPKGIPQTAVVRLPFKLTYPGDKIVNRTIYSNGHKYRQDSILDLEVLKKTIPWSDSVYADGTDFMSNVLKQFAAYLSIINEAEQSNRKEYHDAAMVYLRDVTDPQVIKFKLTSAPNYATWLLGENVAPLVEGYKGIDDQPNMEKRFGALAKACFDAMLPTAKLDMSQFVSAARNMETVYKTIRDLFIKLGSYNVFYLETSRERNEYITFRDPDIYFPLGMDFTLEHIFGWTHENYPIDMTINQFSPTTNLPGDYQISTIIPDIHANGEIGWDANITDMVVNLFTKFSVPVKNEITHLTINYFWEDPIEVATNQQVTHLKVSDNATIDK